MSIRWPSPILLLVLCALKVFILLWKDGGMTHWLIMAIVHFWKRHRRGRSKYGTRSFLVVVRVCETATLNCCNQDTKHGVII
jgi:hypothetical protein